MPNLSCGHEPTKVLRFSTLKEGKAQGQSLAIISLCDDCWSDFLVAVEAAKANPVEKYIDTGKVLTRVFVAGGL